MEGGGGSVGRAVASNTRGPRQPHFGSLGLNQRFKNAVSGFTSFAAKNFARSLISLHLS